MPEGFRFVVKCLNLSPTPCCAASAARPRGPIPAFSMRRGAAWNFVAPCVAAWNAEQAGPLVFQFSPLPPGILADTAAFVERLSEFLAAVAALAGLRAGEQAFYAVEFRDPDVVTPRMMRMLAERGARYCAASTRACRRPRASCRPWPRPAPDRWWCAGACWRASATRPPRRASSPSTRSPRPTPPRGARWPRPAGRRRAAGQPVWITANNKAEGSAPLHAGTAGARDRGPALKLRPAGPARRPRPPATRAAAAARFSRKCATDEVPGISSRFGERAQQPRQRNLHRRGAQALRRQRTAPRDCSGVKPPSGKNGT